MRLPFMPTGTADGANGKISTAWLITFTDLVGLLLAFFIMLFAMSAPDEDQWAKLAKLFAGQLTIGEAGQTDKAPPPDIVSPTQVPAPERGLSTDYLASVLMSKLASEPLLGRAQVQAGREHVAILLDAGLLLQDGAVSAASAPRIAALRGMIAPLPNAVRVEMRARGRALRPEAWTAALAQATAVADALVASGYARPMAVHAVIDSAKGEAAGSAGRIAIVISE